MKHVRLAGIAGILMTGLLWQMGGKAHAQEWTRFRGPNGSGISTTTGIPVQLTAKETRWKTTLPGEGHASPVLWGNRLFVTSAETDKGKQHLLCLDATSGKVLWTRSFAFKPYHTHEFNNAASATPTVDAERVYVLWPGSSTFLIVALDHAGKEVWRRDMGAFDTQHGGATSPIVHDGLLIFPMEPEEGNGALVALDARTGTPRWKHPRPSRSAAYSTPLLYKPRTGPAELVFTSTTHGFTSLNPKTGSVNWELGGVFRARCVGSPIQLGDLIFGTAGNGGGDRQAVAIRPTANGSKREVAFRVTRGAPYVPTPIAYKERLYLWNDGGVVSCVQADSGETVWAERVGGNFFGSPVCIDGRLYAISTRGELVVVATGDRFQLLGKTDLGEASHATPAVANGTLYLRTLSHVVAIRSK